jgi:LemA protein
MEFSDSSAITNGNTVRSAKEVEGSRAMSYGVFAAIIGALLLLYLVATFNSLVRLRNRVTNGWSDIDVQLKRRHDLIPNLVETARGYMAHERQTLDAVTQARGQAMAAGNNVAQRSAAEALLTGAVGNLFAVAEKYPALRAVESMKLLQEELTSTENRVAFARQFYNDAVMEYNTVQSTFPHNLIAGMLGFAPATMFTAETAERTTPQVEL